MYSVKPPIAWAGKGDLVEEWTDVHFFRPLGYVIARAAIPLGITADQVTVACLLSGLAAGWLFYFSNPWYNLAGFGMFILSDVLDSADGQVARLRGTSSRFGRILDGVSDNLRFINLYLCLMVRLRVGGWGWEALALATVAGVCHSLQSTSVDFIRQAFLNLGEDRRGELDLVEDLPLDPTAPWWRRVGLGFYKDYVRNQERLFPWTVALVRQARGKVISDETRHAYVNSQSQVVKNCAWIGQNIRFVVLGLAGFLGYPAAFFWVTAVPFTAIWFALRTTQERHAARLAAVFPAEPGAQIRVA
jgi:hypothetical protein